MKKALRELRFPCLVGGTPTCQEKTTSAMASRTASAPLTFDLPISLLDQIEICRRRNGLKTASEVVRLALEEFDFERCDPARVPRASRCHDTVILFTPLSANCRAAPERQSNPQLISVTVTGHRCVAPILAAMQLRQTPVNYATITNDLET